MLTSASQWLQSHETLLWWLTGASALMAIATALALPVLVARIPHDYFSHRHRHRTPFGRHHPLLRGLLIVLKNLLGGLLLLAGVAMLVLPGQGILTMVMGLVLLDVPGKYRFECWLVQRPPVWRAIAWLRRKAGQPPLARSDEAH